MDPILQAFLGAAEALAKILPGVLADLFETRTDEEALAWCREKLADVKPLPQSIAEAGARRRAELEAGRDARAAEDTQEVEVPPVPPRRT